MNCIKAICINREDLALFSSQLRTGFWQHWPFGTIPRWGHPPPLEAEEIPQRESLNPVQNPPGGQVLQDILLQDSDGPEPGVCTAFWVWVTPEVQKKMPTRCAAAQERKE